MPTNYGRPTSQGGGNIHKMYSSNPNPDPHPCKRLGWEGRRASTTAGDDRARSQSSSVNVGSWSPCTSDSRYPSNTEPHPPARGRKNIQEMGGAPVRNNIFRVGKKQCALQTGNFTAILVTTKQHCNTECSVGMGRKQAGEYSTAQACVARGECGSKRRRGAPALLDDVGVGGLFGTEDADLAGDGRWQEQSDRGGDQMQKKSGSSVPVKT